MKRGKDDDKVMGPMFPRLHVNDTEKGGPRAPPRNKMALYEQLSIPSQRFNSGRLPLNSNSNSGNLIPPVSSNQGSRHERSITSPLHVSPSVPTSQADKPQNHQLNAVNLNSSLAQFHQGKKIGDEDDFRVPIFFHSDTGQYGKNQSGTNGEKVAPFSPSFSAHSEKVAHSSDRNSSGKNLRQTSSMGPVLGMRSQGALDPKESISTGHYSVNYATNLMPREDRPTKTATASSVPELRYRIATNSDRPRDSDACLQQDYNMRSQPEGTGHGNHVVEESRGGTEKNNTLRLRRDSHFAEGRQSSPRKPVNDCEYRRDQIHGSIQIEHVDRSDNISEASMVDSMSGMDISPDNVVGIIGYKHFLKARKAIVNQQRVFAVQVFELHRLIKVQRLIAGSPQILIEDSSYLTKPTLKVSPAKKLPLDNVVKPLSRIAKLKDNTEKPNHNVEWSAENAVKTSAKNTSQLQSYGPYTGNSRPVPIAPDTKMAPWWHHQPAGHQWLVPVMSLSEGLIYKPYPGSSFMGPGCGGCGPMGIEPTPLAQGNIDSPPYGIPPTPLPYPPPPPPPPQGFGVFPGAPPAGHGYGYFPPYGMPIMNLHPAISGSAVEQIDPFAGPHSQSQPARSQGMGTNSSLQHQSSCNLRNPKNRANSRANKFPSPRGSEVQGSTASSPSERSRRVKPSPVFQERDELPLFPMNPTIPEEVTQVPDSSDQPTRVIRVVPHNPRSATESAARIFQSIQEERKQFDST